MYVLNHLGHFGDIRKGKKEGVAPVCDTLRLICSRAHAAHKALSLLLGNNSRVLLGDASLLTGELTQIVEFGATHLTYLVYGNTFDVRTFDREDTFHTNGARHLTNREATLLLVAADFNHHATIKLDSLLVTLDNFVCHSHRVTCLEGGMALASGKRCFRNF